MFFIACMFGHLFLERPFIYTSVFLSLSSIFIHFSPYWGHGFSGKKSNTHRKWVNIIRHMPVPKYYIHCYALFPLLLSSFRDCQECTLLFVSHSSTEYTYEWQKKVNPERRSQVDRVWSCIADLPYPIFPISPLCSPTHCNWGESERENLPFLSQGIPGRLFQQYHKFKWFNHLWFLKYPFW